MAAFKYGQAKRPSLLQKRYAVESAFKLSKKLYKILDGCTIETRAKLGNIAKYSIDL